MEYCEIESPLLNGCPIREGKPSLGAPIKIACQLLCDVRAFGSLWDGFRVLLEPKGLLTAAFGLFFAGWEELVTVSSEIFLGKSSRCILLQQGFHFSFYIFSPFCFMRYETLLADGQISLFGEIYSPS